ncbi:MAG: DNA-directed RNA polymerase subunit alpha [Candidatus Glassbacteria bacterium]
MDVKLDGFVLPKRVEKVSDAFTESYGEFLVQPLERGFGVTLGNAMRRILLSSIDGVAVWGIRAKGILHELSSLPGVTEDMPDIVLNFKQLVLVMDEETDEEVLHLKVTEPGDVIASNIEENPKVRIVNPQLHLFTLQDKKTIEMDIYVKRGRGYVPANQHNVEEVSEIGFITVDSLFNPVTKANFVVESARVGQRTDYDKLILQVWTNKAIKPEEAVYRSASILLKHVDYFLSFEEAKRARSPEDDFKANRLRELLSRSVDELELSVRSGNCLKSSNIRTLGDLVQKTEAEMLKFKNFGKKSLKEIEEVLSRYDLKFGLVIEEGPEGEISIKEPSEEETEDQPEDK